MPTDQPPAFVRGFLAPRDDADLNRAYDALDRGIGAYRAHLAALVPTLDAATAAFVHDCLRSAAHPECIHDERIEHVAMPCVPGDTGAIVELSLRCVGRRSRLRIAYDGVQHWSMPDDAASCLVQRHELVRNGDLLQHTFHPLDRAPVAIVFERLTVERN